MDKNEPQEFNHYQHNAPEYTEEILWHRVYAVIGGIALIIALLGWGVFALMSDRNPEPVFSVDSLAASGAIPAAEITAAQADPEAVKVDLIAQEQVAEPQTSNPIIDTQEPEPLLAAENIDEPGELEPVELAPAAVSSAPDTAEPEIRHKVDTTIFNADITHAALTNTMRDLEPATELTTTDDLGDGFIKLYFYTDLQGHAGDTLIYSWYRNDKRVAKVRIPVGSDRWRSHASKNISANMRGSWKVVVTDRKGHALAESHFYLPESAS